MTGGFEPRLCPEVYIKCASSDRYDVDVGKKRVLTGRFILESNSQLQIFDICNLLRHIKKAQVRDVR